MKIRSIKIIVWAVCFALSQIVAAAEVSTLFTNVKVFDGVQDKLFKADVLVVGNKIETVSEKSLSPIQATHMQVIDGGGRTLMPGMINSHTHLTHTFALGGIKGFEASTWEEIGSFATASAREQLMNGFTTVRDMGGMADGVKRNIDRGLLVGPRIYPAGAYISQTSGHGDFRLRSQPSAAVTGIPYSNLERLNVTRIADGVPAMLNAVRDNFANGAAYIKIHAGGGVSSERDPLHVVQYSPEELAAANRAVRSWDTYWTVHAYTDAAVMQALDAEAQCIDHAQMISEKTMKRIVREGIFLSSNLAGISTELLKHPVYGDTASPVHLKLKQFQSGAANFTKYVKKHRPKWVFGTDIVFSTRTYFRQHMDYEKYFVAKEFGNHYALMGLTSVPGQLAALTGKNNPYPGKLGVIEEGAYADILLVDGNPLQDVSAIGGDSGWFLADSRGEDVKNIRLIMKDGRIYKNTL